MVVVVVVVVVVVLVCGTLASTWESQSENPVGAFVATPLDD
jgi:hypothetical protein